MKFSQKHKVVNIDNLRANTWNPNEQSSFMQGKTKLSIHNHDAIEPPIVRSVGGDQYEIIDGYHRWLAMRELGYKEIGIIDLGEVEDEVAKTMTMTMNEIKGVANEIKLSKILNDLVNESDFDQILEEMPYDKKTLEALLKKTANNWDDLKPEKGPGMFIQVNEETDLRTYVLVLPKEKFDVVMTTIKQIMENTQSSEGRAVELMCADVIAGM